MLTDGMSLMSWDVTDVLSCLAHALATDKYRREGVRRSRALACAAEPRPRRAAADTRRSRDKYRREKVRPKAALAS